MRKCRAWDKELETYLDPEHFYITGEGRGFTCEHLKGMYSDRYELMGTDRFTFEYSTGLKDKNGKEIYEGDIVRFTTNGKDFKTATIEFQEHCYHAGFFPDKSTNAACWWEIIGNKWKNGDLLDDSKKTETD